MSKRADKDELGKKMEQLAEKLADQLIAGNEPSKPMSDMFGKLTSYFGATRKLNLKTPLEDDDDTPTFDKFRRTIDGTEAGNA